MDKNNKKTTLKEQILILNKCYWSLRLQVQQQESIIKQLRYELTKLKDHYETN